MVSRIICDGKKIRPQIQILTGDETYDKMAIIPVNPEPLNKELNLMLRSLYSKENNDFGLWSYTEGTRNPRLYKIPHGTSVLTISYSVLFPSGKDSRFKKSTQSSLNYITDIYIDWYE